MKGLKNIIKKGLFIFAIYKIGFMDGAFTTLLDADEKLNGKLKGIGIHMFKNKVDVHLNK